MIDTNTMRAVWCDDDTVHLVDDPEAIHWSDSVAIAVLCDEVDRLRAELDAKSQIFDAEKTCGELSCDECNARYAEAKREIDLLRAELQAERAMRLAEKQTVLYVGEERIEYRGDTK